MERFWAMCAAALFVAACNPKSLKQGYCHSDKDCPPGKSWCNPNTLMCTDRDASTGDADAHGDADAAADADAHQDTRDAEVMLRCPDTISCEDGGYDGAAGVCEKEAGMCVECVEEKDCASKPKTPICEAHICRACKTDAECKTDPNICMADGHCATPGEVIYVEFNAAGCPAADGTTTKPFCTPNEGVSALSSATMRTVIVIRGATNNQMNLATTGVKPVVVGKKNSGGADASVLVGAATGITVASDDVLIRDLSVNLGSTGSKGIVVSGAGTKLQLVHVNVSTGMGLGLQADNGAQLTMDRCTVTANAVGGLVINAAGYDIQNSIFAANGFSQLQFSATISGSPNFRFNTVVATTGNAAICDVTNKLMLSDSIIAGGQNCMPVNSFLSAPTFVTTPPYHLTGSIGCPGAPAAPLPDHDIDGDARKAPLDCGADQFVQ